MPQLLLLCFAALLLAAVLISERANRTVLSTAVLFLLAAAGGTSTSGWQLLEEIGLGVLVGLVVPMVVLRLERLSFLQATKGLQPLLAVSIGLLVLGICTATHANLF